MLPTGQFQSYVKQQELFTQDNKIILAVSGGKDSVVMLHLFKAIKANFVIAHCNFNLRPGEAERDELFVRSLAKSLEVEIFVTHFDTKKYALENKISTQMAARDLRYTWFEELRKQHGFDYIAVAQHQNDAVETVLINLIRGTGISGLHGILPKRGNLIRPLLFLNRDEIEQIIIDNKIAFVEDSSNASTNYTRNKLRHKVVPLLKEVNPNLEQTFQQNISRFTELEIFLQQQIAELAKRVMQAKGDDIHIALSDVKSLNPAGLLFFELLRPYNFTENVIGDILNALEAQTGKQFFSTTHQITLNRSFLILSKLEEPFSDIQAITAETKELQFGSNTISLQYTSSLNFDTDKNKAFIDADLLIYPLSLRSWQNGDKFIPLGMKNFKKVSDFFIDEKLPLTDKNNVAILVNGNGDLVWIAGWRCDNRYKITKATKKVVIFESKLINGK